MAVKARKVYAAGPSRRFDRNLVVIGGGSAGWSRPTSPPRSRPESHAGREAQAGRRLPQHRLRALQGADPLGEVAVAHAARASSACRAAPAPTFRFRRGDGARAARGAPTVEPHDSVERYTGLGVDVVEGTAKIVSPWEVEITRHNGARRALSTRSIVIAAGARPFVPPIPGHRGGRLPHLGYRLEPARTARRLVVLGGGPIGCELTQAFARLGAR
jgi:hypothetical protein